MLEKIFPLHFSNTAHASCYSYDFFINFCFCNLFAAFFQAYQLLTWLITRKRWYICTLWNAFWSQRIYTGKIRYWLFVVMFSSSILWRNDFVLESAGYFFDVSRTHEKKKVNVPLFIWMGRCFKYLNSLIRNGLTSLDGIFSEGDKHRRTSTHIMEYLNE